MSDCSVAFSEYIFNIILWKNMKSAIGVFSWTFHITSLSLYTCTHTHPIFRSRVFFMLLCFAPLAIFLCKWCRMDEWCKMNWNWNDWNVYRESRFKPRAKLNVLGPLYDDEFIHYQVFGITHSHSSEGTFDIIPSKEHDFLSSYKRVFIQLISALESHLTLQKWTSCVYHKLWLLPSQWMYVCWVHNRDVFIYM